jgi:alcohol dehydrogenase class IV
MLPPALRVNRNVAEQQLAELAVATSLVSGTSQAAAAEALIERIVEISQRIGIPRTLTELGVRRDQIPELVRDSRGNSMDGNPRLLDDAELTELLEELL